MGKLEVFQTPGGAGVTEPHSARSRCVIRRLIRDLWGRFIPGPCQGPSAEHDGQVLRTEPGVSLSRDKHANLTRFVVVAGRVCNNQAEPVSQRFK